MADVNYSHHLEVLMLFLEPSVDVFVIVEENYKFDV